MTSPSATAELDQNILKFLSMTHTDDVSQANNFIEMAQGDLNSALQMFYDFGVASQATSASTSVGFAETPLKPEYRSSDSSGRSRPKRQACDTPGLDPFEDESYVRPAAPQYQERLLEEDLFASTRRRLGPAAVESYSSRADGPPDAFDRLFALPEGVSSNEDLDATRSRAIREDRWVIVNVQAANDWKSMNLNRDVWQHDTVNELLRGSLLLWQRDKNSTQGEAYVTRYRVKNFPHVAAVDPRTGQEVKVWDVKKLEDGGNAASEFSEFLEAFGPLLKTYRSGPSVPSSRTHGPTSSSVSSTSRRAPDSVVLSSDEAHCADSDGSDSDSQSRTSVSNGQPSVPTTTDKGRRLGTADDSETKASEYNEMNCTLAELHRMRRERQERMKSQQEK